MSEINTPFLETLFDLSYLAGVDGLHGKVIEDSRELFGLIDEWATEFEERYPLTEEQIGDFSIVHGVDYLTAIDNFYIEKRNEYMRVYCNITSKDDLYKLFNIKS